MKKIIAGALLCIGGILLIFLRMRLVYSIVGKFKTKLGLLLGIDKLQIFMSALQIIGIVLVAVGLILLVWGILIRPHQS